MNLAQAIEIILAARSGYMVAVNAVLDHREDDGIVSLSYGPKVEATAAIALAEMAAVMNQEAVMPMENGPILLPIGNGQISVFSKPEGFDAIPGYFDASYTFPISVKRKEK